MHSVWRKNSWKIQYQDRKKGYDNMKFKNSKSSFISLHFIIIYFVLVILDVVTTLLTDLNLKHEGNPISNFFVDTPAEFVVYVALIALISVLLVVVSNRWMIIQLYSLNKLKISFKYILSFIIIVFFYTHILSLLWVIPNNILHFIGINGNSDWLFYKTSAMYVNFCSLSFPWFQISMQIIAFIISIAYFAIRKRKIISTRPIPS